MDGGGSIGGVGGAVGSVASMGPLGGITSLGAAPAAAPPSSVAAPPPASSPDSVVSISTTGRTALSSEAPAIANVTTTNGSVPTASLSQVNSSATQDAYTALERDVLEINHMDELVAALLLALLLRHDNKA
ncbi:MAG: hypothetical protein P4L87_06255 [Formivibrio sp.]|nr:hypothetical protein [Formivibrio sp.]